MLPSNKIKVGSGCKGDFFPPDQELWVRQPRVAPPPHHLRFPNLQIWALMQRNLVGVYFLPNLISWFWASATRSVQPLRRDAAEISPGAPLYFATEILPWWVIYFLSTYSVPRTAIFPRKHFSSQETGVDSEVSPYVPSTPAHLPLETCAGCPGGEGFLGPEGKEKARQNTSYSLQDRQSVLGAPLADLSSHQRVSESHNISRCSPREPCTGEPGLRPLLPLPPWARSIISFPEFLG